MKNTLLALGLLSAAVVSAQTATPAATPASAPKPLAPANAASDPRNDLSTALPDLLGLVQSGNFATVFTRYAPPALLAIIPPEQRAQMGPNIQTAMQAPQAKQNLQMMTDILQAAQTLTPTLNATGDRATYQVTQPVGAEQATGRVTFQKVDGQWYLDTGLLMSLAQTLGLIPAASPNPTATASSPAPTRAARPPPDTHGVDMRTQSGPATGRYSAPAPMDAKLPTFWVIGDSTVRNGTPGNGSTNAPDGQWGWGAPLTFYFDPAKVNVVNRALGGTSARTFYNSNWKNLVDLIKKGDVVIMQFGTNDGGVPATSAGELRGLGEESQDITNRTGQAETIHTYGWYMRQMIAETRAKGATPIVCSLIPRKRWTDDGHINRDTATFAGWARQVAEAEKAGFIDLNELIARKYDVLGKEKVDILYVPTPAEAAAMTPPGKAETVHTGWEGAVINAEVVVSGLKALKDNPVADYFSEKGKAIATAPDLAQPANITAK